MNPSALVALARIAPIEHEHAAVGTITQVESAKPGVAKQELIGAVVANIARAGAFEDFLVRAVSVIVEGKGDRGIERANCRQENHRATVGVPSAESVGCAVARCRPAFGGFEVPMVRMHDRLVSMRGHLVNAVGCGEVSTGIMCQRRPLTVFKKCLTELIPVHSPRVHGAMRDHLKHFARGW